MGVPDVLTGEVQEHVSARFRVFQNDAPGVRQVKFHGVRNADGNEVVLEVELAQGRLVVFSPEVADHDDHGGFFLGEDELLRHLGDALVRPVVFAGHDFTHDAQRLFHALGGGDVAGLASAVDEQAAFVPALGRAEGEHRRDFRRVVQFGGAGGGGGGVVHGAADIHGQNDGLLPFFPEASHVRRPHSGRYLPVDETGIVPRHVFPEVVKVQSLAAEAGLVLSGEVFRGQVFCTQFNAAYALENV